MFFFLAPEMDEEKRLCLGIAFASGNELRGPGCRWARQNRLGYRSTVGSVGLPSGGLMT